MTATINGPAKHWTEPGTRERLWRYWRNHLAVRASGADSAPDLHAMVWELGEEHGIRVHRLDTYYLVPAAWLPEILARSRAGEEELFIRRLPDTLPGKPVKPPSKVRTATFVGGPLDGMERPRSEPGRWAAYLDDEGNTVSTRDGDAEFSRAHGRKLSRFYLKFTTEGKQGPPGRNGPSEVIYVHASAIRQGWSQTKWKESRS